MIDATAQREKRLMLRQEALAGLIIQLRISEDASDYFVFAGPTRLEVVNSFTAKSARANLFRTISFLPRTAAFRGAARSRDSLDYSY